MLQNLHVKNLALIDECEVEFSDGLNILSGETGAGKSIIMISSEMDELIGMSDRIIVLHEGKISGELQKGEFDQETILKYGSGYAVEEQK